MRKRGNNLSLIIEYSLLIAFSIIIILPLLWVFMSSFKSASQFPGNPWAFPAKVPMQNIFDNYKKAFIDANMKTYFLNSILITMTGLAILIILSVPCAYALTRFKFFGRKFLSTFLMAGLFVNISFIAIPIYVLLSDFDTSIIEKFSLENNTILINNRFMVALIYASTALPFSTYILAGFFKTISKTYEEAAKIDGCNGFQVLFHVMIPLAIPSIIIVILFNFLGFWNEYILASIMLHGDNQTLPVGVSTLVKEREAYNPAVQYAGLCIVLIPTIALYLFVQKQLTKGMTLGGLKE